MSSMHLVRMREEVARQVERARRFFYCRLRHDRSFELWLLGRLGSRCRSELTNTFGDIYYAIYV